MDKEIIRSEYRRWSLQRQAADSSDNWPMPDTWIDRREFADATVLLSNDLSPKNRTMRINTG
jgi:hypothetical protein